MIIHARFYLTIGCAWFLPAVSWAVVTSDTPGSHVVIPGETAFGVNLDGVALLGFAVPNPSLVRDLQMHCTGSLISDRHVLSAAHCFDGDSDGIVDRDITDFPFAANAIVAGFELPDRTVFLDVKTESITFPPAWPETNVDMAIIELVEDAPVDIPRYPLYSLSDEIGKRIVIAGYGDTGHGSTGSISGEAVKRAGLNRYDSTRWGLFLVYDFDSGLPENNSLGLSGAISDLGFGADEVMNAQGDSGGPTFIGGAIAGITALNSSLPSADVTDSDDYSWGEGAFNTRVSLHQDFLIDATGGQVVFVPEPSSWFWQWADCCWSQRDGGEGKQVRVPRATVPKPH